MKLNGLLWYRTVFGNIDTNVWSCFVLLWLHHGFLVESGGGGGRYKDAVLPV